MPTYTYYLICKISFYQFNCKTHLKQKQSSLRISNFAYKSHGKEVLFEAIKKAFVWKYLL